MVKLAKSMAGHDRGRIFAIMKEEAEYVFLADGRIRLLENPKRKNRKHIQVIEKIPESARALLDGEGPFGNVELKRAIKLYEKSLKQEDHACQKQM